MSSDEAAIRLRNVSKHYLLFDRPEDRLKQSIVPRLQRLLGRPPTQYFRNFAALHDVSFEVKRGETVGIIGRNGSGKSTLLQIICGTLPPSAGTVEVNGPIAALLELGAGFNPEFTGHENVYMNGAILGLSNAEMNARFDAIADFAGIGQFIELPVKLYSSGMYARLAFAVAAHVDAEVLIVDEILSVGDRAFNQKCMKYFHEFKRRGTLLFCSHDIAAISAFADRAIWMDAGAIRAAGSAKDVCEEYRIAINVEGDSSGEMKFGGRQLQTPLHSTSVTDHRSAILKGSTLRNDIEIFEFNQTALWFGQRRATIQMVRLKDQAGNPTKTLVGGENVTVEVVAEVHAPLNRPIIGFGIRNRLGQTIFGDNTHLTYNDRPVRCAAEDILVAHFKFQMPFLPTGDYSIHSAIADGTQTEHVQQHWIDDALFFHVHSSHVAKGLCGIPMESIELSVRDAHD